MTSKLERLAEAITLVGKQSGPAMQGVARAEQDAARLVVSVPNDNEGYARTIRTQLYEGIAALRDTERALADFDKQADAFAKRLVTGGGGVPSIVSTGSAALTTEDVAALRNYTGVGFADINGGLRGGAMSSDAQQRADHLSAALAKLPSYRGEVFRGTRLTSEQIASYVPGQFRSEAAFTSTTRDPACAFTGNVLFVIDSKAGKDIHGFSMFSDEQEVLFDKQAKFYVHGNKYDPGTGKHVIVLVEV